MNIELDPEAQRFIAQKVSSGVYPSASAAVNDLVAAAKAQEEWTADDLAELRAMVALGAEQAARGESRPWDPEALKHRLRARAISHLVGTT